jgi:hypothetical protein
MHQRKRKPSSERYAIGISKQQELENEIYRALERFKDVDLAWNSLKNKHPNLGRWRVKQEASSGLRNIKDNAPYAPWLLFSRPDVSLRD